MLGMLMCSDKKVILFVRMDNWMSVQWIKMGTSLCTI